MSMTKWNSKSGDKPRKVFNQAEGNPSVNIRYDSDRVADNYADLIARTKEKLRAQKENEQ